MLERERLYSPAIQALRIKGVVFRGPEKTIDGRFVRFGNLFFVPGKYSVGHAMLITERLLGADQSSSFLRAAQTLANFSSAVLDAGWIDLSLLTKRIILYGESYGLCENPSRRVPDNIEARRISGEIVQSLCPGFEVEVHQPDYFKH